MQADRQAVRQAGNDQHPMPSSLSANAIHATQWGWVVLAGRHPGKLAEKGTVSWAALVFIVQQTGGPSFS